MKNSSSAVIAKMNTRSSKSLPTVPPPNISMIMEAISTLKDRNGSSQIAIAKAMEERHKKKLSLNFKNSLSLELKKLVETKRLVKIKASYKLVTDDLHKKSKKRAKMKRLSQVKTPERMKNKPSESKRKA